MRNVIINLINLKSSIKMKILNTENENDSVWFDMSICVLNVSAYTY